MLLNLCVQISWNKLVTFASFAYVSRRFSIQLNSKEFCNELLIFSYTLGSPQTSSTNLEKSQQLPSLETF